MSTISTNAIQSVAATLDLGVQGGIKAKMNADNTFSSVIPGFGSNQYPEYKCRAWVNFNGADGAIRAAGNVSSVTRSAAGAYVINFSEPMPDTNYSASTGNNPMYGVRLSSLLLNTGATLNRIAPTVTQISVDSRDINGNQYDAEFLNVSIFR